MQILPRDMNELAKSRKHIQSERKLIKVEFFKIFS